MNEPREDVPTPPKLEIRTGESLGGVIERDGELKRGLFGAINSSFSTTLGGPMEFVLGVAEGRP